MLTFTVGRGSAADVKVGEMSVSRVHLKISQQATDSYLVQDMGSVNGSYLVRSLGKIKLDNHGQLASGEDQVKIGNLKASINQLVTEYQRTQGSAQSAVENNTPTQESPGISRYVRGADGKFERK